MKKEQKNETRTTVVQVDGLTAEEERILRMRAGAGLASGAPLGSKLDGVAEAHRAELEARLLLMEAEAISALTEEGDERPEVKSRIVAALKNKPDS